MHVVLSTCPTEERRQKVNTFMKKFLSVHFDQTLYNNSAAQNLNPMKTFSFLELRWKNSGCYLTSPADRMFFSTVAKRFYPPSWWPGETTGTGMMTRRVKTIKKMVAPERTHRSL